jgi:hypothetical protein
MHVVGVSNGQVLKGRSEVAAVSSFNLGGFRVEFEVTGILRRTAVIGTGVFADGLWLLRWNTHDAPSGTDVLRSIAFDPSKGITTKVAN